MNESKPSSQFNSTAAQKYCFNLPILKGSFGYYSYAPKAMTLQSPKSVRRERNRCWRCQSRTSPAVYDEDHSEAGRPSGGYWWGRYPPGPILEQMDAWRILWPHGKPTLEKSPLQDLWTEEPMQQICWQNLWPCGRPTSEQSSPEGLCFITPYPTLILLVIIAFAFHCVCLGHDG